MAEKLDKIGFIGLGLMGLPMAQNLLKAGASLRVFNRTLSKAAPLVALGAQSCDTSIEVANLTKGGIIILCVSDTPAMLENIESLTKRDLTNTLVIDMGTTTVEATRTSAEMVSNAGGSFIDAPVSGGTIGAQEGSLTIMVGGNSNDIARAQPVFSVLGKSTTHIGRIGAGQIAKAVNQAIVGATMSIVGETMLLASKAGADPAKMREALLGGFAGSRILDLHGQRMIDRRFEPGGRARTQAKDLVQASDLAASLGLSLPLLEYTRDLWLKMVDADMGDLDQSGYLAFLEASQEP